MSKGTPKRAVIASGVEEKMASEGETVAVPIAGLVNVFLGPRGGVLSEFRSTWSPEQKR